MHNHLQADRIKAQIKGTKVLCLIFQTR